MKYKHKPEAVKFPFPENIYYIYIVFAMHTPCISQLWPFIMKGDLNPDINI